MSATLLPLPPETEESERFLAAIADRDYPCVGAKSVAARGNLQMAHGRDLTSGWNDLEIHRALMDWSRTFRQDRSTLRSFMIIFDGPLDLTEEQYEAALWERLQSYADKDAWLGQSYAEAVSANPLDPHFSVSFGGEAFFVVGLHPGASRPARRFPRPAIVFNLHQQFEKLREEGRYQRMRDTIMERDFKFAGSVNPMLASHGEQSAARQYSGREVGTDWECPFKDKRA